MQTEEEIRSLLQDLESAFGDLQIPMENNITLGNTEDDLESAKIREKFRNRYWQDLTIADLVNEADSLCFFTPEAFRFFLPAFIRVSVLDPFAADLIPWSILWNLATPEADSSTEHQQALLEGARRLGLPEGITAELATGVGATDDAELDAVRRSRIQALNKDQKGAIMEFVAFLKKHRGQDFRFRELDRVEEALRG